MIFILAPPAAKEATAASKTADMLGVIGILIVRPLVEIALSRYQATEIVSLL